VFERQKWEEVYIESRGGLVWVINNGDGEVKCVGDIRGSRLGKYLSEIRGLECL